MIQRLGLLWYWPAAQSWQAYAGWNSTSQAQWMYLDSWHFFTLNTIALRRLIGHGCLGQMEGGRELN